MLAGTALIVLAAFPGALGAAVGPAGAGVALSPCGPFEEHLACGSSCPRTCTNQNPVCDDECVPNVCQCIDNFARDLATGACVPISADAAPAGFPVEDVCDEEPECLDQVGFRCKAGGGLLDCADGSKCVEFCRAESSLAVLLNAKRTKICAGATGAFVSCPGVTCRKNDVCTGPNEIYRDCGECEDRCDNRSCDTNCPQTCVCQEGFTRSDAGVCVEKITCEEPQECEVGYFPVEVPADFVDGCVAACAVVQCLPVPDNLDDGAKCGSESQSNQVQAPSAGGQPRCESPSTCLDAGVCGREGERIRGGRCIGTYHAYDTRECDRMCDAEKECVAWEYRDHGPRYYGSCRLLSRYHKTHPYYNLRSWGRRWRMFTDPYTSVVKR